MLSQSTKRCRSIGRAMPLAIGAVLMTALAGTGWISITAKALSPVSFFPIALILSMSVALGVVGRSLCLPRHEPIGLIDALLSGVFLASLLLFGFAFTLPFGLQMNVLLPLLLTTGATTLLARSKKLAPLQTDGAEWGAIAISLVAATAWSQETLAGLRPGPEGLVSSPWGDVLVHATRLFSFVLSPSASALQDPTLAGQPLEFYHYGSYFLPAALMRLGEVDAYTMAADFYPAFGLFLTGLAAFAVIRTFSANGAVALIGSALFMLLPDPSFQEPDNRFTSYFLLSTGGRQRGLCGCPVGPGLERRPASHSAQFVVLFRCGRRMGGGVPVFQVPDFFGLLTFPPALFLFFLREPALVAGGNWVLERRDARRSLQDVAIFTGAFTPFVLLQLWYNHARFGSIFETGLSLMAQRAGIDFFSGTPLLVGLQGLLLSPGKGFFLYAPITILFFFSIRGFFRRHKGLACCLAAIATAYVAFIAKNIYWHGDWSWGPRYIFVITPLLMIPVAEFVEKSTSASKRLSRGLCGGLFVFSAAHRDLD